MSKPDPSSQDLNATDPTFTCHYCGQKKVCIQGR